MKEIFDSSKRMTTALLVAAMLALTPNTIRADDPPPQPKNLIIGCMLFAVGAVIIIGVWYACKHIPPPPGTCPCGCGSTTCDCRESNLAVWIPPAPPTGAIVTNPPAQQGQQPGQLEFDGYAPGGPGSFTDDLGRAWDYQMCWSLSLQTSTDLTNWSYAMTFCGWLTPDYGALVSVRSNGVTLTNTFFTNYRNPSNSIPLDLPGGPKRFYRIACQ